MEEEAEEEELETRDEMELTWILNRSPASGGLVGSETF